MKQRWYDKEPTLSLAISLLKSAPVEQGHKCADLVIEMAMSNGIVLNHDLKGVVNYILNRWYDKDEIYAQAIEYIHYSDVELRRKIALYIIDFLQNV